MTKRVSRRVGRRTQYKRRGTRKRRNTGRKLVTRKYLKKVLARKVPNIDTHVLEYTYNHLSGGTTDNLKHYLIMNNCVRGGGQSQREGNDIYLKGLRIELKAYNTAFNMDTGELFIDRIARPIYFYMAIIETHRSDETPDDIFFKQNTGEVITFQTILDHATRMIHTKNTEQMKFHWSKMFKLNPWNTNETTGSQMKLYKKYIRINRKISYHTDTQSALNPSQLKPNFYLVWFEYNPWYQPAGDGYSNTVMPCMYTIRMQQYFKP